MNGFAYTTSVSIRNTSGREFAFHLEPWADQFPMPVGATFQIVAKAPAQGEMEIEVAENHVVVWGWTGSVLSVFWEGHELGAGTSSR